MAIQKEYEKERSESRRDRDPEATPEDRRKQAEERRKQAEERRTAHEEQLLGVLKPYQQKKWQEMIGEPFTPERDGPGGAQGRGGQGRGGQGRGDRPREDSRHQTRTRDRPCRSLKRGQVGTTASSGRSERRPEDALFPTGRIDP